MLSLNCKHVQHCKICLPCNFEVNPVTHMVGRSWHVEHVCSLNLTFISNSFWNKGRKVLKCWKFDEKRVITPKQVMKLPCNFEVNPLTYFGVISLFWSNFQHFNTFRPLFQKLLEINVKFKQQTCLECQDLPTMQFWSKSRKLFWSYFPFCYGIYFKIAW
jgi:hypothetical protein